MIIVKEIIKFKLYDKFQCPFQWYVNETSR